MVIVRIDFNGFFVIDLRIGGVLHPLVDHAKTNMCVVIVWFERDDLLVGLDGRAILLGQHLVMPEVRKKTDILGVFFDDSIVCGCRLVILLELRIALTEFVERIET